MFVKICGMTRLEDVLYAAALGADAVGFIFAPSPRQVTPETLSGLQVLTGVKDDETLTGPKALSGSEALRFSPLTGLKALSGILAVGVFVDEDIERVREIRDQCHLDIIQLHGDESPDYCDKLGGRLFKAFRLRDEAAISRFNDYPPEIYILLDAYVRGVAGGTGRQIDSALLDKIPDFSRIILAGGIGPDNAVELISRYQPFGIDVNSQVEKSPGVKDHAKISRLFENLKIFRETKF